MVWPFAKSKVNEFETKLVPVDSKTAIRQKEYKEEEERLKILVLEYESLKKENQFWFDNIIPNEREQVRIVTTRGRKHGYVVSRYDITTISTLAFYPRYYSQPYNREQSLKFDVEYQRYLFKSYCENNLRYVVRLDNGELIKELRYWEVEKI